MRELLQQTLEFCKYAWRDISLNQYAFEQLEKTIEAIEAELAKPEQEPFGWHVETIDPDRSGMFFDKSAAVGHQSDHGGEISELYTSPQQTPDQEPVQYLANGCRFKVSILDNGCCILPLPNELNGKWVALVDATDDKHLKCTAKPEQVLDDYALVPIKPTKVMLDAMDGCSREGYGEPLYAGHAASVYYAALNAATLSARQDPKNESRSKQEAIAWIPEDELPDSYPYDLMYQYSRVDMIRLFPVYAPSQHSDCEIKS